MAGVIAGDHHKRHLEVLLELIVVGQILHRFAALLEGQTVIGEVDHGEGAAAVAQLVVKLAEQGVGLRD